MKRTPLILSLLLTTLTSMATKPDKTEDIAPLTSSEVFADLPISILDIIDRSRRLDMLDYYAADSIAQVPNAMEGLSHLDTVTPSYLKVIITPVTDLAIKVLPGKKSPIILTAYTIGDKNQAYDTDLRFYDTEFNEIKRDKLIKIATLSEFFSYPDKETRKLVESLVPFPTIRYEAEPDGTGLSAELTVGQFMSADDYAWIKKYLRGKLHYRWTGSKFNLEK